MFRGPDVGLPFDNPGGDPRPQPARQFSPREALKLSKSLGYAGFEGPQWRDADEADAYLAAQKEFGLECVTLGAGKGVRAPGCSLVDPSERSGFLREVESSLVAAERFGCKRIVVLSGMSRTGVSQQAQEDSCVATLRAAVPLLEKHDVTIVMEPINSLVTRPGFFMDSASLGFRILSRVDSPRAKLLFDIYHVQVMEGNLIPLIKTHIDQIGHFQIGDHPGRHQPGTGEINHRNIFRVIHDLQQKGKYDGYVSLEYHPTVELPETMRAVRELANFG